MEGCLLVVEDDTEIDPYDGVEPGNEVSITVDREVAEGAPTTASEHLLTSTRTATPLSFQTFGGNNSPRVQNSSGTRSNNTDLEQLPVPDNTNQTRPSLDSFQSSSPSTAPPSTPTRLDCNDSIGGNTSPTSPLTMSDLPTTPEPTSSRLVNTPIEKPRTLRSRREFRMFDNHANHDFQSGVNGLDMSGATGETRAGALQAEAAGTLRRNKRKPRPTLGVATFASSNGANSPGAAIIQPSPLSPVAASPQTAGPPETPSISYIPQSSTPHSIDGITTMEPISPDVTLDLPSSQYIFIPGTNSPDPSTLMSPFGTTFVTGSTSATGQNGSIDSHDDKSTESAKGGAKLQYKPRRRIPTPRRGSIMAECTLATGLDEAHAPGSYQTKGSSAYAMEARDTAPASHEQHRALGGPEVDGKGRRPSLSRWSFGNPDGGIGKGMMKRLSRLRSNSDLRPSGIDPHASKSAVDPKLPHSSHFSLQDGSEYRGYASDGVPSADAPNRRRKSSGIIGSGMGARLSKMLPLPFPARRQTMQHPPRHQNSLTTGHDQMDDEENDTDAHLWATALTHSSIPSGRSARLSGAGSARGGSSADGAHRHSTITVRSNDGWFTTMPASSASLSQPVNGSPISAHFTTLGNDISGQNSPSSHNPSRTSLIPAVPPPAFPPHAPYHSASDPTTPAPGSASAAGNTGANEGSTSRRHSEQTLSITAADLLKPPSQRGSLVSPHATRPRPQSLQHGVVANGPALPDPQGKAELLNGIQHGPDSVRLLDVETAAAIRRSIDFDDRVRKGENVLRRALYGSESRASPPSASRASSFSTTQGGHAHAHGRHTKATERSSSTIGRSTAINGGVIAGSGAASLGPGTRRGGSVDHVRVGRNGLLTSGGIFLPSARSPATRYTSLNGSFHSTSSSGLSTPFHSHEVNGSGILRNGSNSASGTLTLGSSTLREEREESFGVVGAGNEKYGPGGEFGAVGKSVHVQPSPTLAKRVGRRISRIFVGKGPASQGH